MPQIMTESVMDALTLRDLTLSYDGDAVVHGVDLALKHRELGCLLGPSVCGKSTLLRAIAGFQALDDGEILLAGETLSTPNAMVLPEHRGVGMVFQDVALFPHLTVSDNIAFGLTDWSKPEARTRISELLDLIGLQGLDARYPHELSGGQQQRVALARAMAPKPKLLLLDEPFSGLDTELRGRLASEVRAILKADGISALLVTHDQREAFDFADRIAVMRAGRIEQFDTAYQIYHEPVSEFVAHFVGPGEVIDASVSGIRSVSSPLGELASDSDFGLPVGCPVHVFLRPDDLIHDDHSPYRGRLIAKHFRGAHHVYEVQLESGVVLGCLAPSHHNHELGENVGLRLELEHLVVFPVKRLCLREDCVNARCTGCPA